MKTDIKVSIIIPVFNTEKYIERCLNSIINQSWKNIEIIIVNDFSTDDSEKIILDYKKKDSRIKYLNSKKRGGPGGARNIGIHRSTGDYISFVDSDDWIDLYMIEKMTSQMENNNCVIGVCGVITESYHSKDAMLRYDYDFENIIDNKSALNLLSRKLNQGISISPIVCNKIYKSSFLKKNNLTFLSNNFNEDDTFNFIAFLLADKVAITSNTYYHYYQRYGSITHNFSKKNIDDLIIAFTVIKEFLIAQELYNLYKTDYYSFYEKCSTFILDMLIDSEKKYELQNKYLQYFVSESKSVMSLTEFIDHMGIQRIKRMLTPYKIK